MNNGGPSGRTGKLASSEKGRERERKKSKSIDKKSTKSSFPARPPKTKLSRSAVAHVKLNGANMIASKLVSGDHHFWEPAFASR